jgi:hypothetical protein
MKNLKRTILRTMLVNMQEDYPDLLFERGSSGPRGRLLLQWKDNDYYQFYFSNEIPNGFRCAFVVDLDIKDSQRRKEYYRVLSGLSREISRTFGYPVEKRIKDKDLAAEGMKNWMKIPNHRWYSIYLMHVLQHADWNDTDKIAGELAQVACDFIKNMEVLLQRYAPRQLS